MHKFVIAAPGTPGATIEYLLRAYGVQLTDRGWTSDGQTVSFAVRPTQARWTTHVLRRAGYAILEGATDDGLRNADGTLPAPWGRGVGAGDLVGSLVDALDRLLVSSANRRTAAAMVQRGAKRNNMWNTLRRLW